MKLAVAKTGKTILFVMATEAEYGPHLRKRFTPLITGVGPIEGAVVLSAALADLKFQNQLPDFVVSIGSAGSKHLAQGAVYQATHVAYRDMDASALGFEKGATPFLNLPVQVPLPFLLQGVKTATLSTGASVVSGADYTVIAEDMVDMETFAHVRACDHFGVKLIALRGISDGAEELQHYGSWADALPALDRHLAETVDMLLNQL